MSFVGPLLVFDFCSFEKECLVVYIFLLVLIVFLFQFSFP